MGEHRGIGPATPEPAADAALLRAVQAGDARAIDRWYRGEHPVVWRTCLGLLADRAEADDAAQEAMLKLHDRLDTWNPAAPYAAWRTRVVVNLCRDRRRRSETRRRAEESAASERAEIRLPDPSEAASQAELVSLVRDVLEKFPEREREAFVLRELEGFTAAEAAEVMEVGESTVRSLATLARRRLRELLAPRLAAPANDGGEL